MPLQSLLIFTFNIFPLLFTNQIKYDFFYCLGMESHIKFLRIYQKNAVEHSTYSLHQLMRITKKHLKDEEKDFPNLFPFVLDTLEKPYNYE